MAAMQKWQSAMFSILELLKLLICLFYEQNMYVYVSWLHFW